MGRTRNAAKVDLLRDGRPRGRKAEHRQTLTGPLIEALLPMEAEYTVRDFRIPQLGVRVRPSGHCAFVVECRSPRTGKQRRLTLGDCATLDVDSARARALTALQALSMGEDPHRPVRRTAMTVRQAFEDYKALVIPTFSDGWQAKVTGTFKNRILPKIGDLPLSGLTRKDIRAIWEPLIHSHGPTSLQIRRIVGAFLSWCVERDLIESNPIKGTKLPTRPISRSRVLTERELAKVWQASDKLGFPWSPFVRLLLLTGQRKSEVLGMHASEISASKTMWEIPAERTKNRTPHRVPLSEMAASIVGTHLREGSHLFAVPGRESSMKFRQEIMDRLREVAGVRNFRLHDLRRSAASHMAALRVEPHVIEAVLNHKSGVISGVAAIYNRHTYEDEKREALDAWSHRVRAFVRELEIEDEVEI